MKIYVNGAPFEKTKYFGKRILLDTMILCYAHDKLSPHRQTCKLMIEAGLNGLYKLHLAYQNIVEFYSVITSKRVLNPLPPSEASKIALSYIESSSIIKLKPKGYGEAVLEASRLNLRGGEIFDAILAFTAKGEVDFLWTENVSDLGRFNFLRVENPLTWKWELM